MSFSIVTVATEYKVGYLPNLDKSCRDNNIDFTILGIGKRWEGFMMKFKLMSEFLETKKDTDIVIFIDGYDVLLLHCKDIISRFREFKKPIVFSIDDREDDNIFVDYIKRRMFGNSPVNAGGYIGYVWALKRLFDEIKSRCDFNNEGEDDQKCIAEMVNTKYKPFSNLVTMDNRMVIFRTLPVHLISSCSDVTKYIKDDPNFVHGPANTDMSSIVEKYHLQTSIYSDFRKGHLLKAVKTYCGFFIADIIIFILIIVVIILVVHNVRKKR